MKILVKLGVFFIKTFRNEDKRYIVLDIWMYKIVRLKKCSWHQKVIRFLICIDFLTISLLDDQIWYHGKTAIFVTRLDLRLNEDESSHKLGIILSKLPLNIKEQFIVYCCIIFFIYITIAKYLIQTVLTNTCVKKARVCIQKIRVTCT